MNLILQFGLFLGLFAGALMSRIGEAPTGVIVGLGLMTIATGILLLK